MLGLAPLRRLVWGGVFPVSLTALGILIGGGAIFEAAFLVVRSPVAPPALDLARALVALLPSLLPMLLPVALMVGTMSGFGRWRDDGTWTALQAAGVAGRGLVASLVVPALAVFLLSILAGHVLAPAGRREQARIITDAASQVRLLPGHFVEVGSVVLLRREDDSLFVGTGDDAILARTASVGRAGDRLLLDLGDGRMLGAPSRPYTLDFESARVPIDLPGSARRIELDERDHDELLSLVERMEANGRDATYERTVLLKRSTLPLAALLLPFLALPLGLRWGGRPAHTLAVIVGYWSLVRIGDQMCRQLGAPLASSLPILGLILLGAVLWATWRDA